jgi:hypothetical protein
VRIGAGVRVENDAGELVRLRRGTTAARGLGPASWAVLLDNARPGELQRGLEAV